MSRSARIALGLLAVVAAFAAIAPASMAAGTTTRVVLQGSAAFPNASGKAKYKVDGANRELGIEVQDIQALAGTRVLFVVDGSTVGKRKVTLLGAAKLTLRTQAGQNVPNIQPGSTVEVRTATGTAIVAGSF
jgi:hypothetical protein